MTSRVVPLQSSTDAFAGRTRPLLGHLPAVSVAVYWFTFCTYETLLSGMNVGGLFYPFYATWIGVVLLAAMGSGIALDRWSTWWVTAFVWATLVAWTRIDQDPSFVMAQRTVAYASCLLVAWQIRSRRGLDTVLVAMVATSVTLSVWTIVRSASADFAVRAFLDVDPNVVTSYVAIGALVALAWATSIVRATAVPRGRTVTTIVFVLGAAVAISLYATLLLASRGGLVAWLAALGGLAWVTVTSRPAGANASTRSSSVGPTVRRTVALLAIVVTVAGVTSLPGADATWSRFATEDTSGAGHRVALWRAVVSEASQGQWHDLLLGHGLESAATVVARVAPSLTAVHQAYLQIGFEMGLVGLASFAALHAHLILASSRLAPRDRGVVVAITTYLMAACLTLDAADAFPYWTALGTCIAALTHVRPRLHRHAPAGEPLGLARRRPCPTASIDRS